MEWKDAKKQLLKKKSLKKAYDRIDLPFEIGKMISDGRIAKKMTQERLAELIGTKQPSIARLERGSYLPSFAFLQKIAGAFNTQLLPPRFEFLDEKKETTVYNIQIITTFPGSYYEPIVDTVMPFGRRKKSFMEGVVSYSPPIRKELAYEARV